MKLTRYWIEFDTNPANWGSLNTLLRAGCGVSGFSLDDCLSLIQQQMLKGQSLPPVKRVVEDVDISKLDANHVLPNIGLVVHRGIWFPTGYN